MTVRDTSRVGGDQTLAEAESGGAEPGGAEPGQAELSGLTTEPTAAIFTGQRGSRRLLAGLRNAWRQLTSMRTALILLFLLAIGGFVVWYSKLPFESRILGMREWVNQQSVWIGAAS